MPHDHMTRLPGHQMDLRTQGGRTHLCMSPAWPLDGTEAALPPCTSGANSHLREDPRKRDPGKLTRSSMTPKPSGQSRQAPRSPRPTHLVFSGLSLPLFSHATPHSSHDDFVPEPSLTARPGPGTYSLALPLCQAYGNSPLRSRTWPPPGSLLTATSPRMRDQELPALTAP